MEERTKVDSATLADKLLDMALSSPGQDDEQGKRYFDEFRFLYLFAVDYTLGLMATKRPIFDSVRDHYAAGINERSDLTPLFSHDSVLMHFQKYTDAINIKSQQSDFWEVGKQFSRFLSEEPGVPHAMEVALGINYFSRSVLALMEFLERCDVED